MDHGYFKDRLSAYLDGELTTEETRAIADHLESCEECRRHLSELKELDRLVAEHSGLEGDDYFEKAAQKIEQSLEEGTEVTDISGGSERRIRGLWWKVTSVAASAAVLVFIGLHQDDIFGPDDLVLPTESTSDKRTPETGDSGELVLPASDETERESSPSEAGYRDDFEAAEEIAEEKVDQDVAKPTLVEKKEEPGSVSAPAPVPMRESEEESDVLMEPMSMPTPVPPAAERARRGAATSAIGDQAPSGGVEDDNYQKSPDVAA
ncbi:MAG: hypothetical protein GY867_09030, partial [bacterium]|nr:hypothetical protein [bacterium]